MLGHYVLLHDIRWPSFDLLNIQVAQCLDDITVVHHIISTAYGLMNGKFCIASTSPRFTQSFVPPGSVNEEQLQCCDVKWPPSDS